VLRGGAGAFTYLTVEKLFLDGQALTRCIWSPSDLVADAEAAARLTLVDLVLAVGVEGGGHRVELDSEKGGE
jgi:hypothetical protein